MKYALLSFALLLSGCAANVEQPKSVRVEVQTAEWAQSWWMPRHKEKIAIKEGMKTVDLVFLGDSITHAFDNKGKEVWQQYYQPRNALNLGFSGDRTENVLWRLENGAVDNIDPKLLVLMIGTNNTGHRQEKPEDTALGIKTILSELGSRLPNTKVLLLAIFPRGATPEDPLRKINDNINDMIENYDDGSRIHYLDINHVFLDGNGNLSKEVMNDLLHPNKDQYKVWAEAIEPKIVELMTN
ncbi:GDSL-type esterase/lipase family protein [Colwelliaceae bacterium BS250]